MSKSARLAIIKQYPNVTDWVTESSFSHPSGYGGRCDLHSPSTGIVIDYKTKDGDFSDGKKMAHEQHYQLGVRIRPGSNLPQAPGMALFVFPGTHPGCVAFHEWSGEDMPQQGYRIFCGCLELVEVDQGLQSRVSRNDFHIAADNCRRYHVAQCVRPQLPLRPVHLHRRPAMAVQWE